MELYYYSKMNKQKQIVYHSLMQGLNALADEIKIPYLEGNELYDVFFQLRLDHPEIFWASGFKYKHYIDSSNLIFIPEYLFEKTRSKNIKSNESPRRKKYQDRLQTIPNGKKKKNA